MILPVPASGESRRSDREPRERARPLRTARAAAALCWLALVACKTAGTPGSAAAPDGSPSAPIAEPGAPGVSAETQHDPALTPAPEPGATQPAATANAPAPAAPASSAASAAPPVVTPAPAGTERRGPPLPELRVKSFGLHVGGSARDAAARADYLRVLEAGWWRYLDCYRLLERPGIEGTFGADLNVPGQGGKASVAHPRTKLRGTPFRECMERAFSSANFEPTPSGRAVVLSYSVKFTLAL